MRIKTVTRYLDSHSVMHESKQGAELANIAILRRELLFLFGDLKVVNYQEGIFQVEQEFKRFKRSMIKYI